MTNSINIICPYCNKVFSLKVQLDDAIHYGQLPFAIVCPECLSEVKGSYGSKGILPKDIYGGDNGSGTVVGYSSSLPVPDHLYLNEDWPKIGLNSVFMNLSIIYGDVAFYGFPSFSSTLINKLFPVKQAPAVLERILPSGNIKAFINAINKEYGKHNSYDFPSTQGECKSFLDKRLAEIYTMLATNKYVDIFFAPFVVPIIESIRHGDPQNLGNLYQQLSGVINLTQWQRNEAYPFITKLVGSFEKIFPVVFLLYMGEFDQPHQALRITTINVEEVNSFYNQGVETLDHIMPFYVGLVNWKQNGDVDCFTNQDAKGISSLSQFSQLPIGGKRDKTSDYPEVTQYFSPAIKTEIRNGIAHNGVQYDAQSQLISYYYKLDDSSVHYDEQLIDVALRCYVLLLHVMEMSHVLNLVNVKK